MVTQFDAQTFVAATSLLRDGKRRAFAIDVETDSTIAADQAQERADAAAMLQAVGGFLQSSFPMIQAMPAALPLFAEMLLFLMRRYSIGVELEGKFEDVLSKMEGGQLPPMNSPQAQAAQLKQQEAQNKTALQQQKMAQDAQDHQMDLQGRQMEFQADQVKAGAEMRKAMLDEQIARADHDRSMQAMQQSAALDQLRAAQPLAPQKLEFGAGQLAGGHK